jgi:hypothetical protein
MACDRHKKREGGEVVPVLRGIAKDVHPVVQQLHGVKVMFNFERKYRGDAKLRVRWGNRVSEPKTVRLEVCDPEHGEGVFRIRTPHPAAIAHAIKKSIGSDRRLAAYRE